MEADLINYFHTFSRRSTNVQLACAISAGLTSAVVRLAERRLRARLELELLPPPPLLFVVGF